MSVKNSNLEFRKIKSLDFLYEINENGTIFRNVKSKKQNKIKLDYHHSKAGYYATFCRLHGKPTRVMIHRAVAECWLGPCPDGYEVDHRDRNSHNNDYRNLRYVTKSEQMKNRNHKNIAKTGSENLRIARELRKKSVDLVSIDGTHICFDSFSACARFISERYKVGFDSARDRLKRHRSHIFDFDVVYRNAETVHDSFTEQETVHKRVI